MAQEHLKSCSMVPIECHACEVELRRGDLQTHLREDCPEAEIECSYADQGCPTRVRPSSSFPFLSFRTGTIGHRFPSSLQVMRKYLEEHLSKEMAYHVMLMKKSFDSCTKKLKDEFESVVKVSRSSLCCVLSESTLTSRTTR